MSSGGVVDASHDELENDRVRHEGKLNNIGQAKHYYAVHSAATSGLRPVVSFATSRIE